MKGFEDLGNMAGQAILQIMLHGLYITIGNNQQLTA
jgi:hypothetical protein